MKKIYILFILLINLVCVFSQGAHYLFEYDVNFKCKQKKKRYYIRNPRYYSFDEPFTEKSLPDFHFEQKESDQRIIGSVQIPASRGFIKEIIFNTARQDENCAFVCWWDSECNQDALIYKAPNSSTTCFNLTSFSDLKCLNNGATIYKFSCYPVLDIKSKSTNALGEVVDNLIFPSDDTRVIEATKDFPTSVYKWKYTTEYDSTWVKPLFLPGRWVYEYKNWKDIPASCYTDDIFSATAKDVLGNSVLEMNGQNIFIAVDLGCDKMSNVIPFKIRASAPHITKTIPTKPKCPEGDGGNIRVFLDRPLYPSEKLWIDYQKDHDPIPITNLDSELSFYIPNLSAGEYLIQVTSGYNGKPLYNESEKHKAKETVSNPDPVVFSHSNPIDISCFEGNNGSFKVTASGGGGGYKLYWRNLTENPNADYTLTLFAENATELTLSGLIAGDYEYYVDDKNDCSIDNPGIQTVSLSQPASGISLSEIENKSATGNGLTNGFIMVEVTGGSSNNGQYTIVWYNKQDMLSPLTGVSNDIINGSFQTKLSDIGAGTYVLSVTDKNGCSASEEFEVLEPGEMKVAVVQSGLILCKGNNTGEIKITSVEGGVPHTSGEPYTYRWFKKNGNNLDLMTGYTSTIASGLSAGVYVVEIVDGSIPANVKPVEVEIKEPTSLIASTTSYKDISCFNGNDGTISLTVSGGVGNYTLYYKLGQSGSYRSVSADASTNGFSLSGLKSGDYYYYVVDGNNCRAQINGGDEGKVTLTQPSSPLEISFSKIRGTSGIARSDGSIEIQVTGGRPNTNGLPYTVRWLNDQGLNLTIINNVDGNGQFTSKIENLPKGTYTVYINDNQGSNIPCIISKSFVIEDPKPLVATLEITKFINCFGESSGEITANVTGGIQHTTGLPYRYTWYKIVNGQEILIENQSEANLKNIPIGIYKVKIEDGSSPVNVTESAPITVTEPTLLQTELYTENITCFDGNNGSIQISVLGGTPAYKLYCKLENVDSEYKEYSFDSVIGKFNLTGLVAGKYSVYILDANGCYAKIEGNDIKEINLTQPAREVYVSDTKVKIPSGFGRSNGKITLSVKGGTPNSDNTYTVIWKDENGTVISSATSTIIDGVFKTEIANLPKGTYSVEIKDKNYIGVTGGCFFTTSFNLLEPDPLTVALSIKKTVDCNGDNSGEIHATATGGVQYETGMPYKYTWIKIVNGNESVISTKNDSIINNLPAGHYKVKIEDSSDPVNSIESSVTVLSQPPLLETQLVVKNILCFGGNDGYIHIKVSGGVPAYKLLCKQNGIDNEYKEYPIDGSSNTFQLNNLVAGKYSVYVLDANGCYAKINGKEILEIDITQPDKELQISQEKVIQVSGFGRNDGEISITIDGGTTNVDGSYNVIWKDAGGKVIEAIGAIINGKYVSTLSKLTKGKYSVEVTDKNYNSADISLNATCVATQSYEITQPDKLIAKIEETHYISCNDMSDGELVVSAEGGIVNPNGGLPYKYKWSRLENGNYMLISGKTSNTLTGIKAGKYKVEIEDYSRVVNKVILEYNLVQPEILVAKATNVNIACGEKTTISVDVTGGTEPYSYEWNTGNTTSSVQNIGAGKFMVFVTDARGCQVSATAVVTTPGDLKITGTTTDPICYAASNGKIELNVSGGKAPYTYLWNTGSTAKDLTNVKAGTYYVTIAGQDGCSFTESFVLRDPQQLTVDLGQDHILCNRQSVTLEPKVEDPKTQFNWSGPNGYKSNESKGVLNAEGIYKLTITDSKGCQAIDEVKVTLRDLDISSEMIVSSQVFLNDTIVVANISHPEADRTEWLIKETDSLKIVETSDHYTKLVFKHLGNYTLGMKSYMEDCTQEIWKTITVLDSDNPLVDNFGESIIEKFILYPNPNSGVFTAKVELNKISAIRIRILQLGWGKLIDDKMLSGEKEYEVPYQLSLSPGIYVVVLETSSGRMNLKMIVN